MRTHKVLHVSIQFIPLEIVRSAGTPERQYLIDMGRRHEEFLLTVGIINTQRGGIAVDIVGVIIGIFGEQAGAVFLPYALVNVCLNKGVMV